MFDFDPSDPLSPTVPLDTFVSVERLRFALRERVSQAMADAVDVRILRDITTNDLIASVEAYLLAERLPPQHVDHEAAFTTPRFASWWDHFVATYRWRWWGRLLRLHEVRYVNETMTHQVRVSVAAHWTYPRATTVLPGDQFGHVVLKTAESYRNRFTWF